MNHVELPTLQANLDALGKFPNFTPPSKHAAGRVGKKRPKRRNRRKP